MKEWHNCAPHTSTQITHMTSRQTVYRCNKCGWYWSFTKFKTNPGEIAKAHFGKGETGLANVLACNHTLQGDRLLTAITLN